MALLIHELLESERLRGKHGPLSLRRANINQIIYQVQGRYFDGMPLVLDLDDNIPDLVVDAVRISFAIKNVIKNALTARKSPEDEVVVTTYTDNKHVLISISDSGIGIAAKDLPHVAEPFFRADDSRQRKTGGFGVGLYLIKAIMDAHHGELRVESGVNLGTIVTLAFPVRPQLYKNN